MEMVAVDSSNISQIGYDADNAVLRIEFKKDNSAYEYYNVPQYEFDALMSAESVGSYANKNIYKVYRQQKVG